MGPVMPRQITRVRSQLRGGSVRLAGAAGLALGLFWAGAPAQAQTCLEQIVTVQHALKGKVPRPAQPAPEAQSIGAQDNQQPTPGSLAAAGLTPTDDGAYGALNQAMNLQATGDEAGCLKALAEARRLGGLN